MKPTRNGILFLAACCVYSQTAAQPTFEVASVKRANSPNGVSGGCHGIDSVYDPKSTVTPPPLGRCVINDARLSHLITIAYGLRAVNLIKAGPDWIARGDDRYNI